MVAPEHVHEREDHGHVKVVVHSHVPAHGVLERHGLHQASLDHDDDPILTLDAIYTVPTSVVLAAPEHFGRALTEPPDAVRAERVQAKFDVPIHGPPRAKISLTTSPPTPVPKRFRNHFNQSKL